MAKGILAVSLLALALCGAVRAQSILDFQELINGQTALVVGAQDPSKVPTELVPQFQVLANTLTSAASALSEFSTDGAGAILKLDERLETALQQIAGIQASTLSAEILSTVKGNICSLAAQIHAFAASAGVTVSANTPVSCFTTPAPVLLWQQQLNDANLKVVGIQNGLTGKQLKDVQALTGIIQEAAAGAGQYATNPTLGFNAISGAISKASIAISNLLGSLGSKAKQDQLNAVNAALTSVKASVTQFATIAGVTGLTNTASGLTGGLGIAGEDAEAPAVAEAPVPAVARRLLA